MAYFVEKPGQSKTDVRLYDYDFLCVCALSLQLCRFFVIAYQASLFKGFSRQEYWSGLLCHPPGDLSGLGIEPVLPASPAIAGRFFTR